MKFLNNAPRFLFFTGKGGVGKTTTAAALALRAAERGRKTVVLTIDPARLSQIRNERRPGSKYASADNCQFEVKAAEAMMRREGIAWLSSTHKSIEEIATTILQEIKPDRREY